MANMSKQTLTYTTLESGHVRLSSRGVTLDMAPVALQQMSAAELLRALEQRAADAAQPAEADSGESEEQGDDGSAE